MIDSERVYTEVTSKFTFEPCFIEDTANISVDDILKRYDEKYEMTWDIKAGLMGKRKCCNPHLASQLLY
jgi:pseudouridine 5'-phosphatase